MHPTYIVGGSLLMLVQGFRHLIVDSDVWRGACAMLLALTRQNRQSSLKFLIDGHEGASPVHLPPDSMRQRLFF